MKRRIAVAVIIQGECAPEADFVMLPPPIEPYYCFLGDDKSKNQPWKRRGKL